ncbi:MAG TPA: DUF262 domain-containing protein [Candidatus Binataceae bacterium]|nr:DUF262 domain-containing protein [Candidatus Binataceae bacterium]
MRDHDPDTTLDARSLQGKSSFSVATIVEAVEKTLSGQWDVPEFQREFIWKPAQVCGLADSLWRHYPVGSILLWQTENNCRREAPLWIADGQQRLTALCLLFGVAPYWFSRRPEEFCARIQQQFDIRYDIAATDGPRFVAMHESRKGESDRRRLIPTSRLLAIDPESRGGRNEMEGLVRELKDAGYCRELDAADLYRRMHRVTMIRQREVALTQVNHPHRDDILEIFMRLNSRGMRYRRLLLKLLIEEIPAAIRGIRGRCQP